MNHKRIKPIPVIAARIFLPIALLIVSPLLAQAHFGIILPSKNQVTRENPTVEVSLAFIHPFEKTGTDLEWPKQVILSRNGINEDLKGALVETRFLGKKAWKLEYQIKEPGVYWFSMEPTPCWQPAKDRYIVHYTKTPVSAFGEDLGWDRPIGLKTEIIPLLRPFGNYAGNTFVGKVLVDGNPVNNIDVEVEHYNTEGWVAPTDSHITQVVKTDDNGVFVFTCPLSGWWGFSALTAADYTIKTAEGIDKPVELGAVIWVYFDPNPFLDN
ncbi:MAG: ATP-dependent DNA ligase [Proteobacteria bacterium]|nr:MAG: ATP-dependent DNA ligase [Pseudomonadota bacterium]